MVRLLKRSIVIPVKENNYLPLQRYMCCVIKIIGKPQTASKTDTETNSKHTPLLQLQQQ